MDLLKVVDTISLWTPAGQYEIQLLYGDITKLHREDQVDLIMVSAFPGDYSPLRGTVIGALYQNLELDVRVLSTAMELDLRRQFCCWLSRPLDGYLPYKRLLCFERQRNSARLIDQIRDMFRMFVPVLNNKETTVITPLLATGHQGHRRSKVLDVMVKSAAEWILAGLSLKSFKIVVYGQEEADLNKTFSDLKAFYGKRSDKKMKRSQRQEIYDIFIMYESEDMQWCRKIEGCLKKKKADIKLCSDVQKFDEEKVWQDTIFQKLSSSLKIVVILTPQFVSSLECLELFNMAMCCNRLRKGNVLQPFYIITVQSMPVYMNLVQYQDCRVRTEQDNTDVKIRDACGIIVGKLSDTADGSVPQNSILDKETDTKKEYDVFISYSHKNPTEANALLESFSKSNPDLKIFFDRSELTMGSLWQKTLYDSVDTARCVIALISQTYITSLVCQEEFNIALLRHLMDPGQILFVPICIESLSAVPPSFHNVDIVDGIGDNFKSAVEVIINMATKWLQTGEKTYFNNIEKALKDTNPEEIFETERTRYVALNYKLEDKILHISRKTPPPKMEKKDDDMQKSSCDVAIDFATDNTYCGMMFRHVLQEKYPGINIKFLWDRNQNAFHDLDTARVVVLFLSKEFALSDVHMQNLHIALCRQRPIKGRRVVHIVQTTTLPVDHSFLRLLPMAANFSDKIWKEFLRKRGRDSDKVRKYIVTDVEEMGGSFSSSYFEYLAMLKVGDDVLDELSQEDTPCETAQAQPMLLNVLKVHQEQFPESDHSTDAHIVKAEELQVDMNASHKDTIENTRTNSEPKQDKVESEPKQDKVELEPKQDKVESEPKQDKVELEPKQDKVESEPKQDKVESEPKQDKVESEPKQDKVESEPKQDKVESEPKQDKVESEPKQDKVESEPKQDKVESEPKQDKAESEPKQDKAESEPKQDKVESEPKQDKVESEPIQDKVESKPKQDQSQPNKMEERQHQVQRNAENKKSSRSCNIL